MKTELAKRLKQRFIAPLLDDIDFNGSRGILVNIAAGEDISLGEFSEVGATIEEFAFRSRHKSLSVPLSMRIWAMSYVSQ